MNRAMTTIMSGCLAIAAAAPARDFYVSSQGSDDNTGTIERPFATAKRARQAVRQLKDSEGLPAGGVTVNIRGGVYVRRATFELGSGDSGQADKPVVYRAYRDEQVRLVGGHMLRGEWFAPVREGDPVWERLDPAARGTCLAVDLRAHGITEFGEPLAAELCVDGRIMQLARWPNEGFVRTTSAQKDITFGYEDPRPERWLVAPDAYAAGYWRHGWANRIERIVKIDTGSKTITLEKAPGYGIIPKKPYYVINLLEEIDTPGEWYLDHAKGRLYFWPPKDPRSSEIILSAFADTLIKVRGATHVQLHGLTVEAAGKGIEIAGGHDNVISKCTVCNIRGGGVTISGERNGIEDSTIYAVGGTGVSLSGGDRAKLTAGRNFVRNCEIHDFGRWQRTYVPAVRLSGVGNVAANNHLYDGPHSAILFGGNEHLIELNEIHDVCYEVDDAGTLYCGRDWGLQGNVIRHNFFHDIRSLLPGGHGVHAVYLDDCASGITVFGNVFYRVSGRAIMCGGGRDNTIENNVIAECGSAHFTDRRGKAWIDKGPSWRLLDKIKRYNYTQPPWSTRYPRLAKIMDNGYDQAKEPEGCVIRHNIGWRNERWLEKNRLGACGGFDFYTIEDNIENQDPRFVDEQRLNLALRDDSPAYGVAGFQRIPFERIGPTWRR